MVGAALRAKDGPCAPLPRCRGVTIEGGQHVRRFLGNHHGPIVLLAILAFAVIRNRATTPREERRTEAGTRELYREEEKITEADKAV